MSNLQNIFNQAFQLHQFGQIKEAMDLYLKILPKQKNNAQLLYLLGSANVQIGHYEQAVKFLKLSVVIEPKNVAAHYNLGIALHDMGRLKEALICYNKALALKPDYADAYNNRGNALKDLNLINDALISYDKALHYEPERAETFYNRGTTLHLLKRLDDALADFNKALAIKPNYVKVYNNRGNLFKDLNRLNEALNDYEKALKFKPDFDFLPGTRLHTKMCLCDWSDFNSNLESIVFGIEAGKKVSAPFWMLSFVDALDIQKKAAEIYAHNRLLSSSSLPAFKKKSKPSKILIGYYSADFNNHATMHLMGELFEKHDKDRFEWYAFSFGLPTNDKWEQLAKNSFHRFIDCCDKTDQEIAKLSRDLGIDIAVDLKGFTENSRPGIFAARAAPIQVNFLGYPGTMGTPHMDYLIADSVLIPEHHYQHYTEKIIAMPNCYQPNCSQRKISDGTPTRLDCHLPERGVVFSSFNNTYKITPDVFASWMRILKAVDGSVLWLLAVAPDAEKNLRAEAVKHGIDETRLIFARKVSIDEHLSRMQLADIMLDTFPCGAHTTCSDALRVGLPVITRMGESFVSRVAGSLLTTIGLPELITHSQLEYENLAIQLACTPDKLYRTREKLKSNILVSPMFDSALFAKNIESAYISIHEQYLKKHAINHIQVK